MVAPVVPFPSRDGKRMHYPNGQLMSRKAAKRWIEYLASLRRK